MRSIVHLSDMHFGRVNDHVIAPMIEAITGVAPDLVAVSGDLTQRARTRQFKDARAFLDRLPNGDDEIAVLGVNTARALTIKRGRINDAQIAWMSERLCACGPGIVKIVVTHHPFDVPDGYDERNLVGPAGPAMEALARCGADVFLAGHLHVRHTSQSVARYNIKGHATLLVQAGTAACDRGRGEANAFNVLRIDRDEIAVERFEWQPERGVFDPVRRERFRHTPDGWVKPGVT